MCYDVICRKKCQYKHAVRLGLHTYLSHASCYSLGNVFKPTCKTASSFGAQLELVTAHFYQIDFYVAQVLEPGEVSRLDEVAQGRV